MTINKIIISALLFLCSCFVIAQPKITIVGGDTYDFGNVAPGVIRHDIKITNIGADTLRITDVAPGCECTTQWR